MSHDRAADHDTPTTHRADDQTEDLTLIAVAAVAENGVIGSEGALPWPSLPADRHQYRARVADDPVALGRRTFEAMQANLPGTAQIVLSRSERHYAAESVFPVQTVVEALDQTRALGADRLYVLGGAAIYALFQPHIDRMVLSRVPGEYEGDAFYPEWDADAWTLVDRAPKDGFTIEQYRRGA
jgi:Dihydrofolate reductase